MTPKQQRALRTRNELVRSAAEVFDQQGFTTASLTAISRQAGVSNGALHFHFESKDSLAAAVESAAAERLAAIAERAHGGEVPALQALVDASHALVLLLRDDVIVRAGFRLDGERAREAGADLRGQWQRLVRELLVKAHEEGALTASVEPADAAAAVVAATVGMEVLGRHDQEWWASRSLTAFWRLLLPRLAAGPVESGQLDCTGRGGIETGLPQALPDKR